MINLENRLEKIENNIETTCCFCNKKFVISKYNYNKSKTHCCSVECKSNFFKIQVDVKCDNCNKVFKRKKSVANRRSRHFCSKECELEFKHKEKWEFRECEICGAKFECLKSSTKRFCSNKCNSQWQKTLTGTKNKKYKRISVECDNCGKKIEIKQYLANKEMKHFCSIDCKNTWHSNVFVKQNEFRELMKDVASKMRKDGKFKNLNTKPQQILNSILEDMGIKYVREFNVCGYSLDNYLLDYNLAIEVNGDYWHSNPFLFENQNDMQIKISNRDIVKKKCIENNGIKILYVWESTLYSNIDFIKSTIYDFIKNKGELNSYYSREELLKIRNDCNTDYSNIFS